MVSGRVSEKAIKIDNKTLILRSKDNVFLRFAFYAVKAMVSAFCVLRNKNIGFWPSFWNIDHKLQKIPILRSQKQWFRCLCVLCSRNTVFFCVLRFTQYKQWLWLKNRPQNCKILILRNKTNGFGNALNNGFGITMVSVDKSTPNGKLFILRNRTNGFGNALRFYAFKNNGFQRISGKSHQKRTKSWFYAVKQMCFAFCVLRSKTVFFVLCVAFYVVQTTVSRRVSENSIKIDIKGRLYVVKTMFFCVLRSTQ